MKLGRVDYTQLKGFKKTKLQAIIEEFIAMETPCVKVDYSPNEYCSATSASAGFKQAINRMNVDGIRPRVIEDKLYLFNTLLIKEL